MIIKGYVETAEGFVHYRTAGSGEPLLLLHQTAFSSVEYIHMIPYLEKKFRVVAMDTLGYGSSDKPPVAFAIEDYGRNIIHFLDALGIQKTNVAGHLTGATLAGEIAASYPERVAHVIMSNVSLYTPEERDRLLKDPLFAPMKITEDGSFLIDNWNTYRSLQPQMPVEYVYQVFVANLEAGPRLYDARYAALRYEKASNLPKIKSPVLAISGENSMFVKKLESVKKLIPRCRTQTIRGGSALPWERPKEFAQAIIDFTEHAGV